MTIKEAEELFKELNGEDPYLIWHEAGEKALHEYYDLQIPYNVKCDWTAELMENAGLATFRNDIFETDPEGAERKIHVILHDIIYRKYMWNGHGGFFPVQYPEMDQRNVELLVQMNNYLAENYDIC
jgi:hypothetical protein